MDEEVSNKMWRLSFGKFSLETLTSNIAEACFIPTNQLNFNINVKIKDNDLFVLPKDKSSDVHFDVLWLKKSIIAKSAAEEGLANPLCFFATSLYTC